MELNAYSIPVGAFIVISVSTIALIKGTAELDLLFLEIVLFALFMAESFKYHKILKKFKRQDETDQDMKMINSSTKVQIFFGINVLFLFFLVSIVLILA